jgi:group I intron endonuclease
MPWTIYCHTHVESSRRYVGQTTTTMLRRWTGHVQVARLRGKHWAFFARAIAKYGPEAFSHQVLETCSTQAQAEVAEQAWILFFQTRDSVFGFNILHGGKASARSLNDKAAQSIRSKEVMARPEVRAKLEAAQATPEWKARFSEIGRSLPHIAAQRAQTHCKLGHEFTPENTGRNSKGGRICRICKNTRERKYYGPLKPPKPPITHCVNGHELTPENVWLRGTVRCCRACNRERQRARNERLKTT